MAEITEQDRKEMLQGKLDEEFPIPKLAQNEELLNINRSHNAWIIIGRDRPAGIESGYGKYPVSLGGGKSTTIDIFVGADSAKAGDETTKENEVGKNFQLDASRIYISQKTDIDKNFLLEKAGTLEPSYGKAAIALKSDNLRFISRESVKIVANCGEPSSLGKKESSLKRTYGIELITGYETSPEEVQGIVKAKNLENCLKQILEMIYSLAGTFHDYTKAQNTFNTSILSHDHKGTLTGQSALVYVAPPLNLAGPLAQLSTFLNKNTFYNISNIRLDQSFDIESKYLKETSNNYIGSIYNKTN